jgi:hypothetical protein
MGSHRNMLSIPELYCAIINDDRKQIINLFDDDENIIIDNHCVELTKQYRRAVIACIINLKLSHLYARNHPNLLTEIESALINMNLETSLFVFINKSKILSYADSCNICLEQFKAYEQVSKTLCKHLFHKACISKAIKVNYRCPTCRKDLTLS